MTRLRRMTDFGAMPVIAVMPGVSRRHFVISTPHAQ
jgi:hypothetical protein